MISQYEQSDQDKPKLVAFYVPLLHIDRKQQAFLPEGAREESAFPI
jgi:hypothetical protein